MTSRRVVRVDQSFFDELDAQLGPDRGPGGEPSSTDFLTFDLPTIVDEFADNFDRLRPAFGGRDDYRMVVSTGPLVAASVVVGQLLDDDTIVLFGIEIVAPRSRGPALMII